MHFETFVFLTHINFLAWDSEIEYYHDFAPSKYREIYVLRESPGFEIITCTIFKAFHDHHIHFASRLSDKIRVEFRQVNVV